MSDPLDEFRVQNLQAAIQLLHNTANSVRVCREIAATALQETHFVCAGCKLLVPNESGASDDLPDHCADCWARGGVAK